MDDQLEHYTNLAAQLIKRYTDIGCTLAEAVALTRRTLEGELVHISIDNNFEPGDEGVLSDLMLEYFRNLLDEEEPED